MNEFKEENLVDVSKKFEAEVAQKTSSYRLERWAEELERGEYVQWSPDSLEMQQKAAESFRERMKFIASEIREHVKLHYGK
jgi:hypothetical protein